ncbi:MAG: preprotein translocase subunit YajC [Alistipes sp.]|nr:preprotein translocase subunit YajC [Alistipes sp.]
MAPAPAQGAAEGAKTGLFGGSSSMIIMMVLIFGVMWLLMIRPQQKQQKELARFRNSLEKGAKVVTAGGIHGTVKEVGANTVTLEIDKNVSIEVDKTMIMRAPGA